MFTISGVAKRIFPVSSSLEAAAQGFSTRIWSDSRTARKQVPVQRHLSLLPKNRIGTNPVVLASGIAGGRIF
jgi:hypothetical protein